MGRQDIHRSTSQQDLQQFTRREVAEHNGPDSCWVIYENGVYDVTKFLKNHPGGDDLVLEAGGADMTELFESSSEHVHSNIAHEWLEMYRIGYLAGTDPPKLVSADDTIDFKRPVITQIYTKDLGAKYNAWTHRPHHFDTSLRFFGPAWMEVFTRTRWWVIPLFWFPVIVALQYLCIDRFGLPWQRSLKLFVTGVGIWTVVEYVLHRFLFHSHTERNLTNMLHFLFHGVHHLVPEDPLRLVMPPLATIIISAPVVYVMVNVLFGWVISMALYSGMAFGYTLYDLTHYYLHHGLSDNAYIRSIKTHHLDHHFKDEESNFGITSKVFDIVFQTMGPRKLL